MRLLNDRHFFSPEDIDILEAAVDRAWQILEAAGVSPKEKSDARLILAKGAVRAARVGERNVVPLSFAACRYWATFSAPKPRHTADERPTTPH